MTETSTRPPLMTLTDRAADQVKALLDKRGKTSAGIRLGIKTKGCSGHTYHIEYADEIAPTDEVIKSKGVTLLIDPKSTLFFIGCEMDYVEEKLSAGFTFRNPNEKGRCGCGESFHV